MTKNLTDNFEFDLIREFPGYNSASDKTKLPKGWLVRGSKNVYKKISGTLATRPGLKRRGAVNSTDAGTKASYEWETSKGTTRPLRINNGKLEVESDVVTSGTYVWYELFTTSVTSLATTLTRWVFDTWWDDTNKKDLLVMARGDEKLFHWSGGMAVVDSVEDYVTNAVASVSINAAGSGYAVGDILTIDAGDENSKVRVASVSSGQIVSVTILQGGTGYSVATAIALTGGSGSGGTINVDTITSTASPSIIIKGTTSLEDLGFSARTITSGADERKIIINGVEYSYDVAIDDTRLTNISPSPTGVVSENDVAIQSVFVGNDASDADIAWDDDYDVDFLKIFNNQLLVGSYSSRKVYIAADINFLDFENAGSYVPGDPDEITLDNQGKGIGEKDGKAIIFAGDHDLYVVTLNVPVEVSFADGVTGNTRFIITKVEKKILPGLNSALGHEFIGNFGDELVWLDQNNQLRALGSYTNRTELRPALLSLQVFEELKEDDFTGGHLRAIEETIYITAPNTSRDWMYSLRDTLSPSGGVSEERIWHPPQVRGISRFALIDGVIYGHSNTYPQLYQVWDTEQWFDDNPSEEEIPYACVARFSYQNHDREQGLVKFDKIYVEGYGAEGVDLNCLVFFDYRGSEKQEVVNINSNDASTTFFTASEFSLGDSPLGDNPLGMGILPEGGSQELLPKFRSICDVTEVDCFEYALEVYSVDENSRWELLYIGTNSVLAGELAVNLRK